MSFIITLVSLLLCLSFVAPIVILRRKRRLVDMHDVSRYAAPLPDLSTAITRDEDPFKRVQEFLRKAA